MGVCHVESLEGLHAKACSPERRAWVDMCAGMTNLQSVKCAGNYLIPGLRWCIGHQTQETLESLALAQGGFAAQLLQGLK